MLKANDKIGPYTLIKLAVVFLLAVAAIKFSNTSSPIPNITSSPIPNIANSPIPTPTSTPKTKTSNTQSFEFETVKVDATGKIIERAKKSANQFIENLGNGIKLEMVEVPSGTFTMGSPSSEDRDTNEEPQHQVTVPAFYIGKFEVTQAQWQTVMGNNPSYFKGNDSLPVEQVSWDDAVEFCRKLSKKTGREYRLPSEAEWEYATRAGTTTLFAFGQTINPEIVNYNGNYPYGEAPKGTYRGKTTIVGSLRIANAFGLYDMHGNVWEWCQDIYQNSYNGAPKGGNAWEKQDGNNTNRILRGGSWNLYSYDCRSVNRFRYAPDVRDDGIGFRVCLRRLFTYQSY
ncbi:MAG: serine/threonine protein kinase [bacterium]|nr:MAG: serine/threonine protein kinase [bacterium]